VQLGSLTADGRVVLTLKHGRHTYGELRFETGLSDRWLTIKLAELKRGCVVRKDGKWYGLRGEPRISAYEISLYMSLQAERIAAELARLRFVRMIVLFGSVPQKTANEYSDLDMIIAVNEPVAKVKRDLLSDISMLESEYHMGVEPILLAEEDFLDNIQSQEGGIIYGVAEGYEVFVDKTGELAEILHNRVENIRRSHHYLEETGIWLKAK